MNCSVCQQETSPVTHGGHVCCSVCNTEYAVVPIPRRLSMDLSPRKASPQATAHSSKPAAALHSRVKPSHVIDLRTSVPHAEVKATPIIRPSHHDPAPPPKATAHEQNATKAGGRIEEAKKYSRSPHINKFAGSDTSSHTPVPEPSVSISVATPQATTASAPPPKPMPLQELPQQAVTHHEAMTRLIAHQTYDSEDNAYTEPKPKHKRRLSISPRVSRIMATTTAVAIMAGYIWLNNYPKLAIQSANNKAGVTAALPSYIPSSYNLTSTDAAPGVVSLSYGSPSASEALKIAQTRTTWDSHSLLDNFVTKNTDDYATVQGQGLTIYLFNNSQATWVNHGIWYSIEGATRLSREQILKIAYSL